jgi:hypothetical protein
LLLDISKMFHPSLSITCCLEVFNLGTETERHIPALQVNAFIYEAPVHMFII